MGVGEIYARFTYRMHNFSEFMKALCGMAWKLLIKCKTFRDLLKFGS